MAEPTVNFNLRMPVDLDRVIRAEAVKLDWSLNATLVAWLRIAEKRIAAEKLERKRE